jgi:hypothetical protein
MACRDSVRLRLSTAQTEVCATRNLITFVGESSGSSEEEKREMTVWEGWRGVKCHECWDRGVDYTVGRAEAPPTFESARPDI